MAKKNIDKNLELQIKINKKNSHDLFRFKSQTFKDKKDKIQNPKYKKIKEE